MKICFSIFEILFLLVCGLTHSAFCEELKSTDIVDSPNIRRFPLESPPLIPTPQSIQWGNKVVQLNSIDLDCPVEPQNSQWAVIQSKLLKIAESSHLKVSKGGYPIQLQIEEALKDNPESYKISISSNGAVLKASSSRGLFYAVQTLEQLILRRDGKTTLATCEITDYPKFAIRGFMNDVGRNYMSMDKIYEIIDYMAHYKYNIYHFHCTDNPGWRLESKRYPALQSKDSFSRKPGKFFTQDEFKALVEYAALRNITIIPELDMPGHSQSFRKALKLDKMEDPKVTQILTDLIDELCQLVPADKMPYIHIGTDETHGVEKVSENTIKQYIKAVEKNGRKAIVWFPGLSAKGTDPIRQIWTGRRNAPKKGMTYIDSQENYLNHCDPFEAITLLYFRKNCNFSNAIGLGGILCSWPDMYIEHERAHFYQTSILPSIVAYAEAIWRDPHEKDNLMFYTNLPTPGMDALKDFKNFEDRLLAHRDRFFQNVEFPYVRQSEMAWKIIGPFPHNGKTETIFPVEQSMLEKYLVEGKEYIWDTQVYTGATILFKHYCNYPTYWNPQMGQQSVKNATYYARTYVYSPSNQKVPFWIGFQTWSTSDLRGGIVSVPGKWFHADSKIWVNGNEILPPIWKTPNRRENRNANIPLIDENYHFRAPTIISLKQGWNSILIKSPVNNNTCRWMFTCIPVQYDPQRPYCNIKEFPELKFSADPVLAK